MCLVQVNLQPTIPRKKIQHWTKQTRTRCRNATFIGLTLGQKKNLIFFTLKLNCGNFRQHTATFVMGQCCSPWLKFYSFIFLCNIMFWCLILLVLWIICQYICILNLHARNSYFLIVYISKWKLWTSFAEMIIHQ